MKNNYLLIFLLSIIIALSTQCKKKDIKTPNQSNTQYCPQQYDLRSEPYPDSFVKLDILNPCPVSPQIFYLEDYLYDEPTLNPNNPYEFAFLRIDPNVIGFEFKLCVYNFCTNQTTVLTDLARGGLDWSVKDWIIFTGLNGSSKIKSNGDSLTQLANIGFDSRWSPNGERYLYRDAQNQGGTPMKIADESGNILSSIPFLMSTWNWLNENEIIYSNTGNNKLSKYDLNSGVSTTILSQAGIGPSGDHLNIDDQDKIYTQIDEGMIRVDLSGNVELLDTNYITFNSGYSQRLFGSKILLKRWVLDTTNINSCEEHYATYISILDESTGKERRVIIPD